MHRKSSVLPILIAALFLGCNGFQMNSRWRDREIVVDGLDADWEGAKGYVEKLNVSIGLMNDESHLFVCLIFLDKRMQAQVMRQGLSVWFDPSGGNGKRFGIRFPLGMQGMRGRIERTSGESAVPNPDQIEGGIEAFQSELEILGPKENDRTRMPLNEANGIEVKTGRDRGILVYELKVPLVRNEHFPYAVGIGTRKTVSIGFETPEIGMEGMRRRSGGSSDRPSEGISPDGRMPPDGGFMPPREGMGPRGRRGPRQGNGTGPSVPGPFELWVKAQLASQNASDHR